MNMPDQAQVQSILRHVYTALGTALSVAVAIGLSQGDATTIGSAVQQIGDGVSKIIAGISTLVPVAMSVWAAISASRKSRMAALNADPEIQHIKTVPGTDAAREAAQIPGNKVT
jgi:hypothetical protein